MAKFTIAKKTTVEQNDKPVGVQFDFANGQKLVVLLKDLTPDILTAAAAHGISQKVGDSYAGAESVEEAYKSAAAVAGALTGPDGSWRRAVAAGERVPALTVEALAELFVRSGKTKDHKVAMEKAKGAWEKMDTDQRRDLAKKAQIKAIRLELQAARAKAKAKDAGDDLSGLFA